MERVEHVEVPITPAAALFTGEDVAELHGHGGGHNIALHAVAARVAGNMRSVLIVGETSVGNDALDGASTSRDRAAGL